MIERKLTDKQQAFVDYYVTSGNAEEAARKAGYNARGNTTKLLQNTTIKKAIEVRNKQIENERIAGMTEVKQFWTETMRNESVEQKDRLKASELIAKTNGAFIEKVEHSGGLNNTNINLTTEERKKRIEELKAKLK